jgi:L-2-hydroxyglutarate oxidase
MEPVDVAVVGAGLVGLATARALLRQEPTWRVAVLEREAQPARHQSGHNSGVVHSGIYYPPGSLKSRLCLEGHRRLEGFCQERGIPFRRLGKVIVASRPEELPRLQALLRQGEAAGVPGVAWLERADLARVEPQVQGLAAVHCPTTAITDYPRVAEALAADLKAQGASLYLSTAVTGVRSGVQTQVLETTAGPLEARRWVNCAGLHADRLARLAGLRPGVRIVPFRGQYWRLSSRMASRLKGLVYPAPVPGLPFLGVHLTPTVQGTVEVGPNAVLAWDRQGYAGHPVNLRDALELLGDRAVYRMARRYLSVGLAEGMRAWVPGGFLREVRRFLPEVAAQDLRPSGSGIRAQAVDDQGRLVDDFWVEAGDRSLHVLNAPSPAATSCLALGEEIAARVRAQLG